MPEGQPKNRQEIIDRACPLPQNKYILDHCRKIEKRERILDLRLANRDTLDTCPVASLDNWAVEMWNEYNLRKSFQDLQNLPEIMFQAFTVIMTEQIKCDNIAQKDQERKMKNDALKAQRGLK